MKTRPEQFDIITGELIKMASTCAGLDLPRPVMRIDRAAYRHLVELCDERYAYFYNPPKFSYPPMFLGFEIVVTD